MIDVYILNTDFQTVGVIDTYESFIWTDRFNSYGDFEIYTTFDPSILDLCQQDYYVRINESDHLMIIEGIEIESDAEDGNKLRITGRSLESIIDRRIVWSQTNIKASTTFQNAIKYLLEDAFIDPQPYSGTRQRKRRNSTQLATSNKRIISNFVFEETDDDYILGLTVEKNQYSGDNIYDIIIDMFDDVNNTVGYRIFLDDQNRFVFKLYSGVDRSYSQQEYVETEDLTMVPDKNYYELVDNNYVLTTDTYFHDNKTYYEYRGKRPFIVFSPSFDNVINSNYIDNTSEMKNVTLVAGEEDPETHYRKTIIVGEEEDLERRELYTNASDLKMEDYPGKKYTEALRTRGYNSLVENSRVTSYEGQVEATRQNVYGRDFFMGDIIQMANEYGIEGNARVIEWVMSDSADGLETYPTFDAVQLIDSTVTEEDNTDV